MTAIVFRPHSALSVTYRTPREGPPSYLVWEPNKSYICLTAADVIKQTKYAKGTTTGIALREWLKDHEKPDDLTKDQELTDPLMHKHQEQQQFPALPVDR